MTMNYSILRRCFYEHNVRLDKHPADTKGQLPYQDKWPRGRGDYRTQVFLYLACIGSSLL